jgi:hypothetical protein
MCAALRVFAGSVRHISDFVLTCWPEWTARAVEEILGSITVIVEGKISGPLVSSGMS